MSIVSPVMSVAGFEEGERVVEEEEEEQGVEDMLVEEEEEEGEEEADFEGVDEDEFEQKQSSSPFDRIELSEVGL